MEGMERRLAVLFADVSGSTRLYEKLGDSEALRAVDRCIKRMERAIEGFGGRLVKVAGDEVMAVFSSADDALQAAVEMQARVCDLPPVCGVKLAIRVGFHFGPVREDGNDIVGETVNVAARLAGAAKSGQILTSRQSVDEMPRSLRDTIRDCDPNIAQGKLQGVPTVEVAWQGNEGMPAASTKAEPIPTAAPGPVPVPTTSPTASPASVPEPKALSSGRLCLRYRGRAYLLDEKTPFLSLGRDPGNDLVVEDRKASRQHARIERRGDKFFYVDQSTNGSYVSETGKPETMLRRETMELRGSGLICFGSSGNDPAADSAEFEHM